MFGRKSEGLKNVCETLLNNKMCKAEQCSNWENRPLRQSQLHYAGLDAWILPQIALAFEPLMKEKGWEMSQFI
tara:strand:- start:275 stop:493 length:219 start_codon:yes stop_codon:yes gene_type:complete